MRIRSFVYKYKVKKDQLKIFSSKYRLTVNFQTDVKFFGFSLTAILINLICGNKELNSNIFSYSEIETKSNRTMIYFNNLTDYTDNICSIYLTHLYNNQNKGVKYLGFCNDLFIIIISENKVDKSKLINDISYILETLTAVSFDYDEIVVAKRFNATALDYWDHLQITLKCNPIYRFKRMSEFRY